MTSAEQKHLINNNKRAARKRRLNFFAIEDFSNVPDFIVDAFFDQCDYRKRLHVSTFCFLNGISYEDALRLIHWPKDADTQKNFEKVYRLMTCDYFKKHYQQNYYSYSVKRGLNLYLDGEVRYYGNLLQ